MSNRVVITGMGVISALGHNSETILQSFKNDQVCFRRSEHDPEIVTGPVDKFDVKAYTGRFKNLRYLNRGFQFALAAAVAAVENSGIDKASLSRAGLFAGVGPNLDMGRELVTIKDGQLDDSALNALWMLRFLPNTGVSAISQFLGIHGENLTVATACSASLQAIGQAYRKIKHGYADLALAGGGDSRLSSGGILAYRKAQALGLVTGAPETASRPFDEARNGFVPGEGGAFFVFEDLLHARQRGAHIYAEICGYGATMDGYAMTAPRPDGKFARLAIQNALHEADIPPGQIDYISSHGTGTPLNDQVEADVISDIFGGSAPPYVIALKSWIGHGSAACGALELGLNLVLLDNELLPPIRNLTHPCRSDVGFVNHTMAFAAEHVLIENFGFGGQNAALVIRKWRS